MLEKSLTRLPYMRLIWLRFGLSCLLLHAAALHAQTLRVVGTTFARIYEQNGYGEFSGMGVDLVRELAQRLGYDVQFELYPWPRAQQMVELGQADVLMGPYKTPDRVARFTFAATPFYRDEILFYARRSSPNWDGNTSSLYGKKVGVVAGWVYTPQFDAIKGNLELTTADQVETGLRMLDFGRIELLAVNQRNTQPVLIQLGLISKLTPVQPALGSQVGYLAFPRQPRFEALRSDMDRVFQQLLANGTLTRLSQKWSVALP